MGKLETKNKLINAARKLCAEKGFHRVQVSDITSEAGLSTGSFYIYFKDKDAILFEILDIYFNEFTSGLNRLRLTPESEKLTEQLAILRRMFRFSLQYNLQNAGVFIAWYRHGYGVSEIIDERINRFHADLEGLLMDNIRLVLRQSSANTEVIAKCISGISFNLSHKMIKDGTPSLRDAVSNASQLIAGGLMSFSFPGDGIQKVERFSEMIHTAPENPSGDRNPS